jgi:hypothetical protein
VRDGAYPSVEAVVEAALEQLEHPDFAGIDVEHLSRTAREDYAAGRTRLADDAYIAEMKARAEAIIASKR